MLTFHGFIRSGRIVGYYRSGGFDADAERNATDNIDCLRYLCSVRTFCLLEDFNLP